MKVYVITAPESVRGIYQTWNECKAKVAGKKGARYQSVDSLEKAEALLGDGIVLPSGLWIFTDGNAMGGVGVVVINRRPDGSGEPLEVSTTVSAVFSSANIRGLRTESEIAGALDRLHNILAELAGLHHALTHVPEGIAATVVYDYKGIGEWMERRWQTKDDVVTAVIAACHREVRKRSLDVSYRHQRGHQKTWAGRDNFAFWNGRADEMATLGGSSQEP